MWKTTFYSLYMMHYNLIDFIYMYKHTYASDTIPEALLSDKLMLYFYFCMVFFHSILFPLSEVIKLYVFIRKKIIMIACIWRMSSTFVGFFISFERIKQWIIIKKKKILIVISDRKASYINKSYIIIFVCMP